MAGQPSPDVVSLLRILGENQQRPAPPSAGHSQPPAPPPAGYAPPAPSPYPSTAAYPAAPGYSYPPQPSASGSIDLSAIRPANSGTVPLADAIAKAKAYAAEQGFQPYDHPTQYSPQDSSRQQDGRRYEQRPRSRSPRGRDSFRDNFNPYRDERRGDHGGQGRDYGRDRSFSPGRGRQGFSPRGGHGGGGRDRSPLRGPGGDSETITIDSGLVGLIIGRQGENMRRVENESGCKIQFLPAKGNESERTCSIRGTQPQREQAKDMIFSIIRDSGMRGSDRPARESGRPGPGPSYGGPRGPGGSQRDDDDKENLQIMVPDRTVGLIIGRGGETIRDLQERSGCHINIVSENKSVNGLRPVNLIGTPAATRHAKELILEIVDSDSRNSSNMGGAPRGNRGEGPGGHGGGGGPERVNDSIFVPSEAVGMIIGKGGETIREMQTNTGCKINVSQPSGPGEVEREIGLVGSRDSIARAKLAIEDKVEAVRQKGSGGGGGGGGRGRGPPRDYDNPNYGQPSNSSNAPQSGPPTSGAPTSAGAGPAGQAGDPYAAYGGYERYVQLWYHSLAANQAQGQPGGSSHPSGTL